MYHFNQSNSLKYNTIFLILQRCHSNPIVRLTTYSNKYLLWDGLRFDEHLFILHHKSKVTIFPGKNRCLTFVSSAESYLLSPSLETVSSGMLDAIMSLVDRIQFMFLNSGRLPA